MVADKTAMTSQTKLVRMKSVLLACFEGMEVSRIFLTICYTQEKILSEIFSHCVACQVARIIC